MNAVLNVMRAETFKLLRKRRLYILAGLYWVVLPVLTIVVARVLHVNLADSFINETQGVDLLAQELASPFGLARVALVAPAFMSPTFFIVAATLLAALFVGDERSQNMWKTVLVVQPKRWAVMVGKVAVALGAMGALLFGAGLSGVLLGTVASTFLPTNFAGAWGHLLGLYASQWLFFLAPLLLAFLLIYLVRSGVLGVVMVLFLPAMLEAIYSILTTIGQLQPLNRINAFFQALRLQKAWEAVPEYFFTANLYAPARAPARDLIASFTSAMTSAASSGAPSGQLDIGPLQGILGTGITLPHAAWVVALYSLLFGAWLLWVFLRRDID